MRVAVSRRAAAGLAAFVAAVVAVYETDARGLHAGGFALDPSCARKRGSTRAGTTARRSAEMPDHGQRMLLGVDDVDQPARLCGVCRLVNIVNAPRKTC